MALSSIAEQENDLSFASRNVKGGSSPFSKKRTPIKSSSSPARPSPRLLPYPAPKSKKERTQIASKLCLDFSTPKSESAWRSRSIPSVGPLPRAVSRVISRYIPETEVKNASVSFKVPRQLSERMIPVIDCRQIWKYDEHLENIPIEYILKVFPTSALKSTFQIKGSNLSSPLPRVVSAPLPKTISAGDMCGPTHLLVVHDINTQLPVSALAIHGLLYACMCYGFASLLPHSRSRDSDEKLLLPVLSIALPYPASMPVIHAYMYQRSANVILEAVLPGHLDMCRPPVPSFLAEKLSKEDIVSALNLIDRLIQTADSLHLCDKLFYNVNRKLWSLLVMALELQ